VGARVNECNRLLTTAIILSEVSLVLSTTVFTNLDECRTECEVSDKISVVAVVYEGRDGWHVSRLRIVSADERQDFDASPAEAKERLSHYVNRFGENVPDGLTRAGLSLWLMQKDDGTAMGVPISGVPGQ
jgi:hypothetical protein